MQDTATRFVYKPRDIEQNLKNEDFYTKVKFGIFSCVISGMVGPLVQYYDGLTFRSGQFQARAMAGVPGNEFAQYKDPLSEDIWAKKNTLNVLKTRSFGDLVYIEKGWKNTLR